MNSFKNRWLEDILIAAVPSRGLKANHCRVTDAINAAYPETTVKSCIVHLVRHSLNFCGWKDRKDVAKSLKVIYQAVDDKAATIALNDFEGKWGQKYPSIAPSWRRAWQEVIPFFAFPPDVRKIIYATKRKRGRCLSSSQKKRNKKRGAVRAKVEHIFRVLKYQFGYRKARYRGLAKNAAQMFSLPLGIMLRITLPGNEWHSPTFTWRGNI